MPVFNNALAGAAGSGGAADFKIERSLRFNDDDSAYLSRDPSSPGNRKTWTWSAWVKRSALGTNQKLFSAGTSSNYFALAFNTSDQIQADSYGTGANAFYMHSGDRKFRDASAWYHIVAVLNTTESTGTDRFKLYVNGSQLTLTVGTNVPPANADQLVNSTIEHKIGNVSYGATNQPFDGYLTEVNFIEGQALAPTDFGEFDADTGVWNPIEYTGSYGQGFTTSQATGALPIYNTTDSYGAVKGSGTRSDSSSSNIELAVAMDGTNGGTTFTDEHATIKGSGSAVALTAVGNVQTVTSQNKFYGSSASFDGSGDYLSFTNIDLQRSNFTYEAWVYATDTTKLLPTVIFTAGFSSGVIHSFGLANSSGSINAVFGASTRPSSGNYYFQAPAITANEWTHIAWVRNGTTISIYVNGVVQTLDTTNGGNGGRDEVTNVSSIGTNDANEDFSGYIQDARVYSTNKYTADFTVAGISNSYHLDFSDNSSNSALGNDAAGSNDWTVNNLAVTTVNYNSTLTAVDTNETVTNPGNAFDGSTDTGIGGILGGIKFTPPGGSQSNVTSLRFYSKSFGQGGAIKLNGSTIESNYDFGNGGWYAFSSSALSNINNTLTSFEWDRQPGQGSNNNDYLFAIEINGAVLVNTSAKDLDSFIDSPTNYEASSGNNGGNYATLNPLLYPANTLSNGNLDATAGGNNRVTLATFGIPASGKWYFEFTDVDSSSGAFITGVGTQDVDRSLYLGRYANGWGYQTHGTNAGYYNNNNFTASGVNVHGGNTVVGIAVDRDSNKLWFSINGTFVNSGDPANGTNASFTNLPSSGLLFPGASSATGLKFIFNAGQRSFAYTPPTGFKSLCTQNLDDPTIANPSTAFDVITATGTAADKTFTMPGGFGPDLVWTKRRDATSNNALFDTVRGVTKRLVSNLPQIEDTQVNQLKTFTSTGFTYGYDIPNNTNHEGVYWCWDAGANSNKTYTVTVVSDSGNKYRFDGHGTSAVTLELEEGSTYTFDQSDSSNSGHPLRFSTTSDGTHNSGSEYTTGVTATGTPGSAGAKTTIVVASGAPTLYYYCSSHSGMGGQVNTNSTAGATVLSSSLNNSFYDTSDTWSDDLSSPQGAYGSSSVTNAFDGSLTVGFEAGNPSGGYSTIRFQPASAITVSSQIRIHVFDLNDSNVTYEYRVNDGSWTSMPGTSSPYRRWQDLGFTGTLNSFEYRSNTSSTYKPTLYAVEIDGKLLIDSGTSLSSLTQYPTITSTVRANPSAGFSIISYTGNDTQGATIGHGLNSTPALIIAKNRDYSRDWPVFHKDLGVNNVLRLNQNASTIAWTDTYPALPTSSVFTVGNWNGINNSSYDYIAYCFAPVEGFSDFGVYTGNGDPDGPFVALSFRPAFLMLKNTGSTGSWMIYDYKREGFNFDNDPLYADLDALEGTTDYIDLLSNGFKLRNSHGNVNALNNTYSYAAFAKNPFKTARAR